VKFLVVFLWLFLCALAQAQPELVIYSYDSLVAKGGLGSALFPLFEKKCGCKIRALPSGDGGQLLSRLQLDQRRGKPTAHVVLGLDQQIWERAKPLVEDWKDWEPQGYRNLEIRVEKGFLPFDYGAFALMADTKKLAEERLPIPKSLADLTKPEYRGKIILEDPRTSTPGLAFLLYTRDVLGKGASAFWERFRGQWLTLTPGWDEAYGLFLKGEAPLVWSYSTSQAYHREHGDSDKRYQAVVFAEGQPVQIEGAALVKGAFKTEEEKKLAWAFLDFLISREAQELVPRKNWMLPVLKGTTVPESFTQLPKATKLHGTRRSASESREALAQWANALHMGH
jgi:thiamine transport system substrate-binding protein